MNQAGPVKVLEIRNRQQRTNLLFRWSKICVCLLHVYLLLWFNSMYLLLWFYSIHLLLWFYSSIYLFLWFYSIHLLLWFYSMHLLLWLYSIVYICFYGCTLYIWLLCFYSIHLLLWLQIWVPLVWWCKLQEANCLTCSSIYLPAHGMGRITDQRRKHLPS